MCSDVRQLLHPTLKQSDYAAAICEAARLGRQNGSGGVLPLHREGSALLAWVGEWHS